MHDLQAENQKLRVQNQYLQNRLRDVEASFSWQLSQEIHALLTKILPANSWAWTFYVFLIRKIQKYINSFNRVISRKTIQHIAIDDYVSLSDVKKRPLISIIMPTYNTPERYLRKAIDSVIQQTYPRWELIIIDDASISKQTLSFLKKLNHPRIQVEYCNKNKGIAHTQNKGIKVARGEYVIFLDHDDELDAHALTEIAYVAERYSPKVIYTDELYMNKHGHVIGSYRKPKFSRELLYAQNYFNHISCFQKTLLKQLRGFRAGFEGSQDHDLLLRAVEIINDSDIYHIPKVLYRWRHHESFSQNKKTMITSRASALRAVKESFMRQSTGVSLEMDDASGYIRVVRELKQTPKVSIIIPFKNKYSFLKDCLESIVSKSTYRNYEIICMDNQSTDRRLEEYLIDFGVRYDFFKVIRYNERFNFSEINNEAVRHASGSVVLFLNNDTQVITPQWIEYMLAQALRPGIGVVGAQLWYHNKTLQHAGVAIGMGGVAGHLFSGLSPQRTYLGLGNITREVSAVTGACMMVRKDLFEQVGGFDPELRVAFNDIELCINVAAHGYQNMYVADAKLYHFESASRGYDLAPQKAERLEAEARCILAKHGHIISKGDAYSRYQFWKQ